MALELDQASGTGRVSPALGVAPDFSSSEESGPHSGGMGSGRRLPGGRRGEPEMERHGELLVKLLEYVKVRHDHRGGNPAPGEERRGGSSDDT